MKRLEVLWKKGRQKNEMEFLDLNSIYNFIEKGFKRDYDIFQKNNKKAFLDTSKIILQRLKTA